METLWINLKQTLLAAAPAWGRPVADVLLRVVPVLVVFPTLFALTTVVERKILARIQNRPGPNRVGIPFTPFRLAGFGQFIADGIKSLTKEDIVPRAADRWVHFLAPVVLLVPVVLSFAVLPYGRGMVPVDLEDAGLLFFFAVGGATELAVFMAGWASRNKYSLLGALRAVSQMISYEIPLVASTLPVVMLTGTLSLPRIVEAQGSVHLGVLHGWHLFTPWGAVGFLLFLVAACAEANRAPFDLPEAESELVAGYFTEYSGFKFALFFLGEYLGLFAVSGLGVTLFLGGWQAPVTFLDVIPSWLWFPAKLGALVVFFIWIRGTVPRLRSDQLLRLGWKFLLPMALLNVGVAGLWRFSGEWPGVLRWLAAGAVLATPWFLYNRAFEKRHPVRLYRYAD